MKNVMKLVNERDYVLGRMGDLLNRMTKCDNINTRNTLDKGIDRLEYEYHELNKTLKSIEFI